MDRTDIDTLKASIDLAELIRGCGLELKKVGKNLRARCPFHDDQDASFTVNPDTQLYHCFGCGEGGDALSFLQRQQGLSFPQALQKLAEQAGNQPASPVHSNGNGKSKPRSEAPESLPGGLSRDQVLGRVVEVYRKQLLESPEAQAYLAGRGLGSRELWESFKLGYADGSLLGLLPSSGPIREALAELGVLTDSGREFFRGCLVVPLEHPDRGVVGLYGRKLDPSDPVPHLQLPGPKLGVLNWQALKVSSQLLVTESALDAMSLWLAGARDVTCLLGTQMPRQLPDLLERFEVREVLLCLDGDRAGREATLKLATELFSRGIRCRRVVLPDGKDPNQLLVEAGPEKLLSVLEKPQPIESPDDSERPVAARREDTGDGFRLGFGDVLYRVSPQPPFAGRLKALVNATRTGHPGRFNDTMNLYSLKLRQGIARGVSAQLEIPRHEAEDQVQLLLRESEDWVRCYQQTLDADNLELVTKEAPEMSACERAESLELLREPHLVDRILVDMEAVGYVGENHGKLLAYLIGISRKLDRPMSGIILSQSGAGKSALTELVEMLTPPEDVYTYSRVSALALAYMPRDYLKHKLLILEERAGGEAADYSIRTLQSRRRLTQATVVKDPVTGQLRTRYYEVEGPIAYLETTTSTRLNPENTSRCFEITLDESVEQTQRIHQSQRALRSLSRVTRPDLDSLKKKHHQLQRMLEPVVVLIPYAEELRFPTRWLRTRRDNERFLCLVEAIAFLHQHQRERGTTQDGRAYVLAGLDDYCLAYSLAKDVLAATLHELTPVAREVWESARKMLFSESWKGPREFTRRELRMFTGLPSHRLRETLDELLEMEYVGALQGSQGRAYRYGLLVESEDTTPSPLRDLTTPEELERQLRGRRRQAG